MKEICMYECEFCGKKFEDEDKCRACEREHFAEKCIGKIRFWDAKRRELNANDILTMKIQPGQAYYIQWLSLDAITSFNEIYSDWTGFYLEEDGANISSESDFIYWDETEERWVNPEEIYKKARELKNLIDLLTNS